MLQAIPFKHQPRIYLQTRHRLLQGIKAPSGYYRFMCGFGTHHINRHQRLVGIRRVFLEALQDHEEVVLTD